MLSRLDTLRHIVKDLPEVSEGPHFDKIAFKVKKKVFMTFNEAYHRICVKLSDVDQSVFTSIDPNMIYPVPNNFGKQGWTLIDLDLVSDDILKDAIQTAYCTVAPKKLAETVSRIDN